MLCWPRNAVGWQMNHRGSSMLQRWENCGFCFDSFDLKSFKWRKCFPRNDKKVVWFQSLSKGEWKWPLYTLVGGLRTLQCSLSSLSFHPTPTSTCQLQWLHSVNVQCNYQKTRHPTSRNRRTYCYNISFADMTLHHLTLSSASLNRWVEVGPSLAQYVLDASSRPGAGWENCSAKLRKWLPWNLFFSWVS